VKDTTFYNVNQTITMRSSFAILFALVIFVGIGATTVQATPCMQNYLYMKWTSGYICDQEGDCATVDARSVVSFDGRGGATVDQQYQCPSTGVWISIGDMDFSLWAAKTAATNSTVVSNKSTRGTSGTFDCGWYGNPFDSQGDYVIDSVTFYFPQQGTSQTYNARTTWGCAGTQCSGGVEFEQSSGQWCPMNL
jgi:hypothetical protein